MRFHGQKVFIANVDLNFIHFQESSFLLKVTQIDPFSRHVSCSTNYSWPISAWKWGAPSEVDFYWAGHEDTNTWHEDTNLCRTCDILTRSLVTDWLTYNIRTYMSASQTKVKVSLNLLEAKKTAWSVFICLSLFLPVIACHCLILFVWLGLTGPYLVYWSLQGLTGLYWAFTGPYSSPLCLPCSHWSLLGLLLRFTGSHRVTRQGRSCYMCYIQICLTCTSFSTEEKGANFFLTPISF